MSTTRGLVVVNGKRSKASGPFPLGKTKQNKMMAHIILSDADKNLERVIAFPKLYTKVLGKMKPGSVCDPAISEMEDGTLYIKEVS